MENYKEFKLGVCSNSNKVNNILNYSYMEIKPHFCYIVIQPIFSLVHHIVKRPDCQRIS